jgi:exodeoxyribonuclease X
MFIRVIDFESSSESPADGGGLVEIGWCDITRERTDLLGEPISWSIGEPQSLLVHPGCAIPPITAAIHHIVDEDVAGARPWKEALAEVLQPVMMEDCAGIAAHSMKFEKLWIDTVLKAPLLAAFCTYKLALRIWPDAPSHSNQALRYWRKPSGLIREKSMPAHRAGPDAYVTAFHLRDILEEAAQKSSGGILDRARKISEQPALQVTCHLGDWRGKKWEEVDSGFMQWVLRKDTFDEDVVHTCKHWLKRREEEREAERPRLPNA